MKEAQRGSVIMTEDLQALLYDCLKVQYFSWPSSSV